MLGESDSQIKRRWPLLVGLALSLAGCSGSSGTPAKLSVPPRSDTVEQTPQKTITRHEPGDPAQFIGEFMTSLHAKEVNPDRFTVAFKKKIALPKPGNAKDHELGYDPDRFMEYLSKACTGTYRDTFTPVSSDQGPWILGEATDADGQPEGFTIHLVPAKDADGWLIDLFYRSKAYISHVDPSLSSGLVGAELIAHCFMDNLLGGDLLLAEGAIARSWKVREYPSSIPSDADVGYSRALVLQRLRGWKVPFTEYAFTRRQAADGAPAQFEVVVLDKEKNLKKTFNLTVNKGTDGEWLLEDIVVK